VSVHYYTGVWSILLTSDERRNYSVETFFVAAFSVPNATIQELTVSSQPNLDRDCIERLPEAVLAYLKKQVN
jgi:hypothetical protein